ncbi:Long-chain-fatty-acid--CoA ligase [Mucinivorans hirudinis]|uniref:Long-chain-fatty-acid--CoA ligase n=1 Tax=Mucinivorans hirudinis TaxID=1433126 RepID=A0A060RD19_9BACT|nr:Long-chain-fatty-acid--CoA ligase [Mucinivorans hirudinis]
MVKENFVEMFELSFRTNWKLPALSDYFKDEESYTYGELAREVARLHTLMEIYDIKRGDKIALIGRNNPKWCISFLATVTYGAVIVPILQDFSANDVHHIINHSESSLLFSGDQYWDNIDFDKIPNVKAAFSLTDFRTLHTNVPHKNRELHKSFYKKYKHFSRNKVNFPKVDNGELMVLNYTSGTTGFSKGVMLTGNNLAGNLVFARSMNIHNAGSRALSFLPLAHAYGCTFDFLYPLSVGAHLTLLGKIPSPRILIEAMGVVKPQLVILVPMLLEKIYKKQILPMLDKSLLRFALRLPLVDTGIYALINKKLTDTFGGCFHQVIVGGAALNGDVEEFLKKIKFKFTVGYGMTECAPLISYAPPEEFKESSCGKALEGLMEVKIDSPDPQHIAGEIIVRGEHVMMGYYKNEEATRAVMLEDGWMRTGDVGTLDTDGTIYIRGRNKTMILGASGQNIYPEEIESKLNNLPCVMESLVVEKEGRLVALVYPDYEQADQMTSLQGQTIEQVMTDNVTELNKIVAPYERIAQIILFPNEFEKTPKKSIKRYLYTL